MKQFSFLITVIFLASTVHAQLNKGQWLVGGTAGFSYAKNSSNNNIYSYSTKSTSLQASPSAGYFIINGLAVGVRPGIVTTHDKIESHDAGTPFSSSSDSKGTGITISPFVRYYFLPARNKINILADLAYGWEHQKSHTQTMQTYTDGSGLPVVNSSTYNNKYSSHSFTVAAGPALFLNPRVSLELLAGYGIVKSKDLHSSQHTVTLNAGFQIHLGK